MLRGSWFVVRGFGRATVLGCFGSMINDEVGEGFATGLQLNVDAAGWDG